MQTTTILPMSEPPPFIVGEPELAKYIASREDRLIVFDGRPLAGKSYMARSMAKILDCTFLDGDHFITGGAGKFVGALKPDELDRAIASASKPPVLLSTVCGRNVIGRLASPQATIIWVEPASLLRLDQIRRDYFVHDDNSDAGRRHPLYKEVEAYIAAHNARHTPDAIYLNAPE